MHILYSTLLQNTEQYERNVTGDLRETNEHTEPRAHRRIKKKNGDSAETKRNDTQWRQRPYIFPALFKRPKSSLS